MATLYLGLTSSDNTSLKTCRSPQGACLSPFLFTTTMYTFAKVAKELLATLHTRHAIYADDVTIWMQTGLACKVVDAQQRAAGEV